MIGTLQQSIPFIMMYPPRLGLSAMDLVMEPPLPTLIAMDGKIFMLPMIFFQTIFFTSTIMTELLPTMQKNTLSILRIMQWDRISATLIMMDWLMWWNWI